VDHGVTGFKARTPEEFTEYALMLCNDAALRKRIGQAAHDDVMARHTVSAKAETWRRAVGAVEISKPTPLRPCGPSVDV